MNEYVVSVSTSKFNIKIIDENQLNLEQQKINFELTPLSENSFLLKMDNRIFELSAEKINSDYFKIFVNGNTYDINVRTALQERAYRLLESSSSVQKKHTEIKAPMPGLILKIKMSIGEKVEKGNSVMILEAMKMENDLKSPASGVIEQIFVKEGSPVEKGERLFSIG